MENDSSVSVDCEAERIPDIWIRPAKREIGCECRIRTAEDVQRVPRADPGPPDGSKLARSATNSTNAVQQSASRVEYRYYSPLVGRCNVVAAAAVSSDSRVALELDALGVAAKLSNLGQRDPAAGTSRHVRNRAAHDGLRVNRAGGHRHHDDAKNIRVPASVAPLPRSERPSRVLAPSREAPAIIGCDSARAHSAPFSALSFSSAADRQATPDPDDRALVVLSHGGRIAMRNGIGPPALRTAPIPDLYRRPLLGAVVEEAHLVNPSRGRTPVTVWSPSPHGTAAPLGGGCCFSRSDACWLPVRQEE